MTQEQFNTNSRKGKHLSYQERCQIAILKKEGYSNRAIAKSLGRSPQTIHNEVNRGSVTQRKRQKQKGKIYDYTYTIYDADAGKAHYDQQRLNCGRRPKWAKTNAFVEWQTLRCWKANGRQMWSLAMHVKMNYLRLPSSLAQPLYITGLIVTS